MNAQEFARDLKNIQEVAHQKIVELVQQAQADEGLSWDTDKAVSFADDPNWQRSADGFAESAGWIYDRLNGRNRLAKRSMTKRIRKALGYAYP